MSINRKTFFSVVRPLAGKLTQSQVNGFNFILDAWEASELKDKRWLAYALATTWHETNGTVQPVREAYYLVSKTFTEEEVESWRKRNLRYYPYYGRGYVQLTWKENYEKYGIADNLDKALEPQTAARIMLKGMTNGAFTGRKFAHYFNDKVEFPYYARRIINGLDKAKTIRNYYYVFKKALEVT